MTMLKIEMCVIGFKNKDFTNRLTDIRKIKGLKVLKRRNKPFYDISGAIETDADFAAMGAALSYLLTHCNAELEINDDDLREKILTII